MSSESEGASSAIPGAIRIPPSAASDVPMAQASIDTRFGRAPFSVESGRSSTAARIAMPMRRRVSTRRRKIATRIAIPIVIAWWIVIVVGPRSSGGLVA